MTDHTAEKNSSYRNRVQRGQTARTVREVTATITTWDPEFRVVERRTFPAGTRVRVISESNAGFRGIEAYVQFAGTDFRTHVSTGALAVR